MTLKKADNLRKRLAKTVKHFKPYQDFFEKSTSFQNSRYVKEFVSTFYVKILTQDDSFKQKQEEGELEAQALIAECFGEFQEE